MKDLGTLGGIQSAALDMNSSGQVTGWSYLAGSSQLHAFLWRNDGTKIQDLNTLLDSTDPLKPYVTLTKGEFINNLGDIVAEGTDSRTGDFAQYLLQSTVLTLAPRSLAFGSRTIETKSLAKSVTVTNTSAKVAPIASVTLTGAAPTQFAQINNCGKSLAGHATCAIKVTFKPTTKGAKSATLNVNGGGGGLRTVTLTGAGT
jgi:probable HAF family extracellular repeat protein